MEINFAYDRPEEGPGLAPHTAGWLLAQNKGAVLYDPSERGMVRLPNRTHAKSACRCPAVIQLESRCFMVKCPFDLHIGFQRDDKGKAVLVNRAGSASPIRSSKLGRSADADERDRADGRIAGLSGMPDRDGELRQPDLFAVLGNRGDPVKEAFGANDARMMWALPAPERFAPSGPPAEYFFQVEAKFNQTEGD